MFITSKYTRSTKSDDAMYAWLENISSKEFELCIREFLPFDGKHQDTTVVSWKFKVRQREKLFIVLYLVSLNLDN